ncbi:manganese transporter [Fusarium oxysporum f. sp. melonis 26406]|uniref:Manganese transporter n=1 Tax=Fusarium oxysporum f. sp. melonis 26406 TaxID=1089452 RepID=W9Z6S3_FUSOX|nr:manganese transporter [Fusarium oxysporum f. sp. melonis 26406]KAJ9421352.1 manganese transporter [Fusarium oxysporum]
MTLSYLGKYANDTRQSFFLQNIFNWKITPSFRMNKTSHTDEPFEGDDGYNQSPNPNSSDLTTNADFNGLVNSRTSLNDGSRALPDAAANMSGQIANDAPTETPGGSKAKLGLAHRSIDHGQPSGGLPSAPANPPAPAGSADNGTPIQRLKEMLIKVGSFIGPGFMISVAYIDPGNYSTDIAAGASYRFRLLFIVLLSNVFAIFLQSLAIKLGTVSGLNLAQACRAFLPRWLNYILYVFAEAAIIATDIAEVIGFAIALNLLVPKIPLVAGCAISILDVMVLLIFYRPEGSMKGLRYFEIFIMCLVLGVVVCFCIQLSLIKDTTPGEVFQGYLPSKYLIESEAIYQACGILGATVMPHSLYLGSGIVQPRLREYDELSALLPRQVASEPSIVDDSIDKGYYVPSEKAIKHSLKLSILDLAISLFTFALFVNSAILIVAGAALYNNPNARDADIFGIHDLLSKSISPAAGTIFALALLLSGVSAGIVCTIAGQMVSEGALNWNIKPWLRRLVTRSISITPSIIIAGAVGREGLNAALNGSQVALSIILPFVTAPLIYFTCRDKYMTVQTGSARWRTGDMDDETDAEGIVEAGTAVGRQGIKMTNSWLTMILAILIWLFMAIMNVANLVFLGK